MGVGSIRCPNSLPAGNRQLMRSNPVSRYERMRENTAKAGDWLRNRKLRASLLSTSYCLRKRIYDAL